MKRDEWKGMNDLILPPVTPSISLAWLYATTLMRSNCLKQSPLSSCPELAATALRQSVAFSFHRRMLRRTGRMRASSGIIPLMPSTVRVAWTTLWSIRGSAASVATGSSRHGRPLLDRQKKQSRTASRVSSMLVHVGPRGATQVSPDPALHASSPTSATRVFAEPLYPCRGHTDALKSPPTTTASTSPAQRARTLPARSRSAACWPACAAWNWRTLTTNSEAPVLGSISRKAWSCRSIPGGASDTAASCSVISRRDARAAR